MTMGRLGRGAAPPGAVDATHWDPLRIAIAGTIMYQVWRIHEVFPILRMIQYPTLIFVGAIALFVQSPHLGDLPRVLKQPGVRWVLLILVLATASIPTSLYSGKSFQFVTGDFIKTVALTIMVACSIRGLGDIERYMMAIVIGAACYCGYVFLNFSVGSTGRLGSLRITYDSNDLALFIVGTLPMAVYFIIKRNTTTRRRLIAAGTALLMMWVFTETGSRGGFLGFGAVMTYMLIRQKSVPLRIRVYAATIGMVLLLAFASDAYWSMMKTMLNPSQDYNFAGNSKTGRMEIWRRGLGYMMQRPIFGVGARAFQNAEGHLSSLAKNAAPGKGVKWSAAHNSFVQIGAELGVMGLVSLIALLLTSFTAATRAPPPTIAHRENWVMAGQSLAASVVGFAVSGFFLSQAYASFLYILVATVAGFASLRDSAPRRPRGPRGVRRAAVGRSRAPRIARPSGRPAR